MPAATPGATVPAAAPSSQRRAARLLAAPRGRLPPWAWGVVVALPLSIAYLIVAPPSGDLAAAAYRSDLFSHAGFTIWDTGWYAGHALPDYSLISPALGAWLGLRPLIALSAVAGSALFGALSDLAFPRRAAIAATIAFAFGFCCELPSGRVPYDLGAAIGLAALLGFARGPLPLWAGLAVLTAIASPVAGAFLGLAGLAITLAALAAPGDSSSGRPRAGAFAAPLFARRPGLRSLPARRRLARSPGRRIRATPGAGTATRGLILCAASLVPILLLAAAFNEGGFEPFTAGAFWPELLAVLAVALLLPRGALAFRAWLSLRIGAALYACALAGAFLLLTPVGSNAVRLGDLVGAPLVVAALWELGGQRVGRRRRWPSGRLVLAGLAPLLIYWQLATSINDQVALAGDPTVNASFYAPLRAELLKVADGHPIRVEVPMTGAHWEAAYLPGGPISLARGWERQLDTRYAPFFYEMYKIRLTPSLYRSWLDRNAVSYVALPHARLDAAGKAEGRLIEGGLPYLRPIWRSAHWRLFAVRKPTPLAQPPARMSAIAPDSFTLTVPRPGSYEVRLRFTPYYKPVSGSACVMRGRGGFTELRATRAGRIRVLAEFSLGGLLSGGPRCGGGAHAGS